MLMKTGSLNQVIFFTESHTMAVDPRDGRLLWSYNKANNGKFDWLDIAYTQIRIDGGGWER